ncbi:MAG: HEPN domain-containing protein [Bacteroidota bacterium]
MSAALLARADRDLDDARYLLDDGRALASVNRAYDACFHAARAVLATVGEAPSTHKGVVSRFAYHFVRTGRIQPATGGILNARTEADYDALTEGDVRAAADLLADRADESLGVRQQVGGES